MISNTEAYDKQLLSEISTFQYLNIKKMKENLSSIDYFCAENQSWESACTEKVFKHVLSKKNLFESQNAKSLCRAGVPCKYMRELLLKMFNVDITEDSFKTRFSYVFKERDVKSLGDFVPYFTGYTTLNESLPVNVLNEDGIQALKEILWMLNSIIPTIEFSPLIIKVASLVLLFCSQAETYEIMRILLEMNYSIKETYKIRWHLRFTGNDHLKIVSSICEALKEISRKSGKESFEHFESINFPAEKLYEDIAFGFMMDYLNFAGMIRLLPFYMLEGIKSIYRLSYALVKTLKLEIPKIQSPDDVLKILRLKSKGITDLNKLFNLCYTFKLTRFNNRYDFQKMPDRDLFYNKRNRYYLPAFSIPSEILAEAELIKLWSLLPLELKIRDAKMIFSTEKLGYSLTTIYGLIDTNDKDSTILFLMETLTGETFGGVMSNLFQHTNGKFIKPLTAILVSIKPKLMLYDPKDCDDIIYCDSTCIMFGNGPNGPAIRIDSSLSTGWSYSESCFGNNSLVESPDGGFKLKKMEIYLLG